MARDSFIDFLTDITGLRIVFRLVDKLTGNSAKHLETIKKPTIVKVKNEELIELSEDQIIERKKKLLTAKTLVERKEIIKYLLRVTTLSKRDFTFIIELAKQSFKEDKDMEIKILHAQERMSKRITKESMHIKAKKRTPTAEKTSTPKKKISRPFVRKPKH